MDAREEEEEEEEEGGILDLARSSFMASVAVFTMRVFHWYEGYLPWIKREVASAICKLAVTRSISITFILVLAVGVLSLLLAICACVCACAWLLACMIGT